MIGYIYSYFSHFKAEYSNIGQVYIEPYLKQCISSEQQLLGKYDQVIKDSNDKGIDQKYQQIMGFKEFLKHHRSEIKQKLQKTEKMIQRKLQEYKKYQDKSFQLPSQDYIDKLNLKSAIQGLQKQKFTYEKILDVRNLILSDFQKIPQDASNLYVEMMIEQKPVIIKQTAFQDFQNLFKLKFGEISNLIYLIKDLMIKTEKVLRAKASQKLALHYYSFQIQSKKKQSQFNKKLYVLYGQNIRAMQQLMKQNVQLNDDYRDINIGRKKSAGQNPQQQIGIYQSQIKIIQEQKEKLIKIEQKRTLQLLLIIKITQGQIPNQDINNQQIKKAIQKIKRLQTNLNQAQNKLLKSKQNSAKFLQEIESLHQQCRQLEKNTLTQKQLFCEQFKRLQKAFKLSVQANQVKQEEIKKFKIQRVQSRSKQLQARNTIEDIIKKNLQMKSYIQTGLQQSPGDIILRILEQIIAEMELEIIDLQQERQIDRQIIVSNVDYTL